MELARYWRYHGLGGLDLMRAQFVRHRFARHSHETYALGTVEASLEEIRFADGVERTGVDEVVLIEPGVGDHALIFSYISGRSWDCM